MKKFFKLPSLLRWIICIGTYWVTAVLYPYNFYYQETYIPKMSFVQVLILAGITAMLGTLMYLMLQILNGVGKWIGMKKNLILYFLYHMVFCTGFAYLTDYFYDPIKIEPLQLYLLLGFFPAMLCSIVFSYQVSHPEEKKEMAGAEKNQ